MRVRGSSPLLGPSPALAPVRASATRPFLTQAKKFFNGDFDLPPSLEKFGPEGVRDKTVVPAGGSRWVRVVPTFATHACLGSPYAWSLLAEPATRELGVAASAAMDWSVMEAAGPMTVCFAFHGLSAALLGKAQIRLGPKISNYLAAGFFGTGVLVGAAGIAMHSLPLLYLGYGAMAGTGIGLGYTTALQALVEYFPDRKALASGLTIGGFGSGPIIFANAVPYLRSKFAVDPEFIGARGAVETTVKDGALVVPGKGEVVLASQQDLINAGLRHLEEGYYLVGSGSTGVAGTLAVLGAGYLTTMTLASAAMTRPSADYQPPSSAPAATAAAPSSGQNGDARQEEGAKPASADAAAAGAMITSGGNVNVDTVVRTPQFYLMASTFLGCAASGMAMMTVAKPMMSSTFASTMPDLVTPEFAALFVMTLSAGNLAGRLFFPMVADSAVGFQRTFQGMTLLSASSFMASPYIVRTVVETGSAVPLYTFVGCTTAVLGVLGGAYAVTPAYEAATFGSKYLAANHGRMLLCSTVAALGGPSLLNFLLGRETAKATETLLAQVGPERFESAFGVPIESARELIDAGTVNVAKLVAAAPEGTVDPSPFLYDSTFYTMGGVMVLAFGAISMIRPLDPSYFEENQKLSIKIKEADEK